MQNKRTANHNSLAMAVNFWYDGLRRQTRPEGLTLISPVVTPAWYTPSGGLAPVWAQAGNSQRAAIFRDLPRLQSSRAAALFNMAWCCNKIVRWISVFLQVHSEFYYDNKNRQPICKEKQMVCYCSTDYQYPLEHRFHHLCWYSNATWFSHQCCGHDSRRALLHQTTTMEGAVQVVSNDPQASLMSGCKADWDQWLWLLEEEGTKSYVSISNQSFSLFRSMLQWSEKLQDSTLSNFTNQCWTRLLLAFATITPRVPE